MVIDMKIAGLFFEVDVTRDLRSTSKRAAFVRVTERISQIHSRLNPDELLDELWEREKLGVTALGFGIGCPHSISDKISYPFMNITQLARPVDYGAQDAVPVDLLVCLLGPARCVPQFRIALSTLCLRMRDARVRAAFRHAQLAIDVHGALDVNASHRRNIA
jgi:PTS system nitrogen regulatory IIA component